MWAKVEDADAIAKALVDNPEDTGYSEYTFESNALHRIPSVKDSVAMLFFDEYGSDAICAESQDQLDELKKAKYKGVYLDLEPHRSAVLNSDYYKDNVIDWEIVDEEEEDSYDHPIEYIELFRDKLYSIAQDSGYSIINNDGMEELLDDLTEEAEEWKK